MRYVYLLQTDNGDVPDIEVFGSARKACEALAAFTGDGQATALVWASKVRAQGWVTYSIDKHPDRFGSVSRRGIT